MCQLPIAGLLLSTALLGAAAPAPLKVGFVYVGPVGDAGWTYQHDVARRQMEQAFKGKVVTQFVESVPEGADAERVIRSMAQGGAKVIFATSFGYMNPVLKVAAQFPEVVFMHATGYKTAANVGVYNARFYEGRYLNGVLAGRLTKTHRAGIVAAFPIPEVVMGINAFALGMRSVDPKAEVRVVWTNSWFDPGKEREAALTLVAEGADMAIGSVALVPLRIGGAPALLAIASPDVDHFNPTMSTDFLARIGELVATALDGAPGVAA